MNLLELLKTALLDKACFLCGEDSATPVCASCVAQFRRCDAGWAKRDLAAGSATGFSLFWYEGPLRQAVLQMKVEGEFQLAGQLSTILAESVGPLPTDDAPLVLPVPRFGHQDPRHHFPSIASEAVALKLHGDCAPGVVQKVRKTALQTKVPDAVRLTNVAGAFAVPLEMRERLRHRTVIIVDDVLTSGATICAVQEAVLEAGPNQCFYLTLARSRATIASGF